MQQHRSWLMYIICQWHWGRHSEGGYVMNETMIVLTYPDHFLLEGPLWWCVHTRMYLIVSCPRILAEQIQPSAHYTCSEWVWTLGKDWEGDSIIYNFPLCRMCRQLQIFWIHATCRRMTNCIVRHEALACRWLHGWGLTCTVYIQGKSLPSLYPPGDLEDEEWYNDWHHLAANW